MSVQTAPLSIEGAKAEMRSLMADTGLVPSDASRLFFQQFDLDDEAWTYFARVGLAAVMGSDVHRFRTEGNGRPEWKEYLRFQPKHKHVGLTGLRIPLEGADGRLKPLGAFTDKDCQHVYAVSRSQARAHNSRAAVMRDAEKLLREHGVEQIFELPVGAAKVVSRAAEEAWS